MDIFWSRESVTKRSVDIIFFYAGWVVWCVLDFFVTVIFVEVGFVFERGVLFIGGKIVFFEGWETSIIFAVGESVWWRSAGGSWGFELIACCTSVGVNGLIFDSFEFSDGKAFEKLLNKSLILLFITNFVVKVHFCDKVFTLRL